MLLIDADGSMWERPVRRAKAKALGWYTDPLTGLEVHEGLGWPGGGSFNPVDAVKDAVHSATDTVSNAAQQVAAAGQQLVTNAATGLKTPVSSVVAQYHNALTQGQQITQKMADDFKAARDKLTPEELKTLEDKVNAIRERVAHEVQRNFQRLSDSIQTWGPGLAREIQQAVYTGHYMWGRYVLGMGSYFVRYMEGVREASAKLTVEIYIDMGRWRWAQREVDEAKEYAAAGTADWFANTIFKIILTIVMVIVTIVSAAVTTAVSPVSATVALGEGDWGTLRTESKRFCIAAWTVVKTVGTAVVAWFCPPAGIAMAACVFALEISGVLPDWMGADKKFSWGQLGTFALQLVSSLLPYAGGAIQAASQALAAASGMLAAVANFAVSAAQRVVELVNALKDLGIDIIRIAQSAVKRDWASCALVAGCGVAMQFGVPPDKAAQYAAYLGQLRAQALSGKVDAAQMVGLVTQGLNDFCGITASPEMTQLIDDGMKMQQYAASAIAFIHDPQAGSELVSGILNSTYGAMAKYCETSAALAPVLNTAAQVKGQADAVLGIVNDAKATLASLPATLASIPASLPAPFIPQMPFSGLGAYGTAALRDVLAAEARSIFGDGAEAVAAGRLCGPLTARIKADALALSAGMLPDAEVALTRLAARAAELTTALYGDGGIYPQLNAYAQRRAELIASATARYAQAHYILCLDDVNAMRSVGSSMIGCETLAAAIEVEASAVLAAAFAMQEAVIGVVRSAVAKLRSRADKVGKRIAAVEASANGTAATVRGWAAETPAFVPQAEEFVARAVVQGPLAACGRARGLMGEYAALADAWSAAPADAKLTLAEQAAANAEAQAAALVTAFAEVSAQYSSVAAGLSAARQDAAVKDALAAMAANSATGVRAEADAADALARALAAAQADDEARARVAAREAAERQAALAAALAEAVAAAERARAADQAQREAVAQAALDRMRLDAKAAESDMAKAVSAAMERARADAREREKALALFNAYGDGEEKARQARRAAEEAERARLAAESAQRQADMVTAAAKRQAEAEARDAAAFTAALALSKAAQAASESRQAAIITAAKASAGATLAAMGATQDAQRRGVAEGVEMNALNARAVRAYLLCPTAPIGALLAQAQMAVEGLRGKYGLPGWDTARATAADAVEQLEREASAASSEATAADAATQRAFDKASASFIAALASMTAKGEAQAAAAREASLAQTDRVRQLLDQMRSDRADFDRDMTALIFAADRAHDAWMAKMANESELAKIRSEAAFQRWQDAWAAGGRATDAKVEAFTSGGNMPLAVGAALVASKMLHIV
jgi:hypothetical protein